LLANERSARRRDFVEHELLLLAAGKTAKFGNELANGAATPEILIAAQMRGNIAFKPRGIVPMRRSRVGGPPLLPIGSGRLSLDDGLAVPGHVDRQMRIEPSQVVGDL